jgi:5-methylcytosine-specific restriction endonuclease McrA
MRLSVPVPASGRSLWNGKIVEYSGALDSSVLVLNRFFMAIHVISARKAFSLLCKEVAEVVHVVDGRYDSFDFQSWREVSQYRELFTDTDELIDWVRTVTFDIRVPRVIRLLTYDRLPRQRVQFNRRNLFARDENRCQYCGRRFPTSELSLDHVVPRSQGGDTSWINVVCACTSCNKRKGGRTPVEARMRLIKHPEEPKRSPVIRMKLRSGRYRSWKNFLNDAYWSVELK